MNNIPVGALLIFYKGGRNSNRRETNSIRMTSEFERFLAQKGSPITSVYESGTTSSVANELGDRSGDYDYYMSIINETEEPDALTRVKELVVDFFDRANIYEYELNDNYEFDPSTSSFIRRQPLATLNVPRGAMNQITFDEILNGNTMTNFHDERSFGRYYKKRTYNAMPKPKKNPVTRRNIRNENVKHYTARITGGRRSSRRRTRKQRGGFVAYPSESFGPNMVDSEEAGGAVVIRNVSGVPTPMSVATYRKEYRGEYDEGV
jgi:hypothetical protein